MQTYIYCIQASNLACVSGIKVKLDTDSVKSTSLGSVQNGRHSDEGH